MESTRLLLLRKLVASVSDDAVATSAALRSLAVAVPTNHLLVEDTNFIPPREQRVTSDLLEQFYTGLLKRLTQKKGGLQTTAVVELMPAVVGGCAHLRLLQNLGQWGEALVEVARREAGKGPPRAAALNALSALLTRLAEVLEVPGVKREGAALVARSLPVLMPCLSDPETPPLVTAAALHLLSTILCVLPTSLRQQSSNLELRLVTLAKGPAPPSRTHPSPHAAARCLALLPRAAGDAAAFSSMCRRTLLSAHEILDLVFMGLENPELTARYKALLLPPTDTPPKTPPTGLFGPPSSDDQPKSLPPLTHLLCTSLDLLESALTSGYPTPAPLPTPALISLARRMLDFDPPAAVAAGGVPYSSSFYADLCMMLPHLQAAAWQLLALTLKVAGPQSTPHHSQISRILQQHLRRIKQAGPPALLTTPPAARQQLYTCCATFARTSGLGPTRALAPEASAAAMVELYGAAATAATSRQSGGSKPAAIASSGPKAKKARTNQQDLGDIALALEFHTSKAAAAGTLKLVPTLSPVGADLAAQAAAVEMLDAVVATAGPALTPDVRAQLDSVVFHAARSAAAAATAAERLPVGAAAAGGGRLPLLRRMQAAAYRALLASVLSPCPHRPPYLSEAVHIFQAGASDLNSLIADFSRAALLSLEALLHPRATPVSAIQQYLGMEEVPPLARPRMWTPFLPQGPPPATQPAAPAATAAGPTSPHATISDHAQNWGRPPLDPYSSTLAPHPLEQPRSHAPSPLPHSGQLRSTQQQIPAVAGPSGTPSIPKEPSLDTWMPPASDPGAFRLPGVGNPFHLPNPTYPSFPRQPTTSLSPLRPSLTPGLPPLALPSAPSLAIPSTNPSLALPSTNPSPAPAAPSTAAAAGKPPAAAAEAVAAAAGALAGARGAEAAAAKPKSVFGEESSDSEGPLPDIDSGESDEDDGMDE